MVKPLEPVSDVSLQVHFTRVISSHDIRFSRASVNRPLAVEWTAIQLFAFMAENIFSLTSKPLLLTPVEQKWPRSDFKPAFEGYTYSHEKRLELKLHAFQANLDLISVEK